MLVYLYKKVTDFHSLPKKPSNISALILGILYFLHGFWGFTSFPYPSTRFRLLTSDPLIPGHTSLTSLEGIQGLHMRPSIMPTLSHTYSFWLMGSSNSTSGQGNFTESFLISWVLCSDIFILRANSGFTFWPSSFPTLLKICNTYTMWTKRPWSFSYLSI